VPLNPQAGAATTVAVQAASAATDKPGRPASTRPGRRRWLRLLRNLCAGAAIYLVFTQTLPRRPHVELVSQEAWSREMAARRGSVVVVPVWASWCEPCIEMLPALAAIEQRYSEQGVQFASLCLDDFTAQKDIQAAEEIVIAHGVRFPHFVPKLDIAESLEALAVDDLPALLIYNQDGEVQYRLEADRWSNEISPADVEDAIDSLLVGTTDEHR
jgi:thiol-disulfide isomerase/thioredoxin